MSEYTPFVGGAGETANGGWSIIGGATVHDVLNSLDDATSYMQYHNTANGANQQTYTGITNAIPSGATAVKLTVRLFTYAAPSAGNTIKFGVRRPADALTYYSATYQQAAITTHDQWVTFTVTIDLTSGGLSDGAGDYKMVASSNGEDSYFFVSYGKLETPTHTVTASSDAHSAFDQEGALGPFADGANLTLTATADSGYRIQDILVDGVSVGDALGKASYVYTFTNLLSDHTITVSTYVYVNSSMTDHGERVTFVYDFSRAFELDGLAQVVGPGGQEFPWSAPLITNSGAMVRTWDGNLYAANDDNGGATANGAIYQLETGLYDTPVKVLGLVSGLTTIRGSLVQSTGVITALLPTDFRRVAVGGKVTGPGITGTATVTAKSSVGDSITVSGTLTGDQTNKDYTCWGREVEAQAFGVADRHGEMLNRISGQYAIVGYACPTGELMQVQHSYDLARATAVQMALAATGAANSTTHRAPQLRKQVELPSASRTQGVVQEYGVLAYNGSAGTDTLGRAECWGLEATSRILRSYQ